MIDAEDISEIWSPFLKYLFKLQKELKCFICNGLLRTPKLLPCNHIVCSCCIITPLTRQRSVCLSCQNSFRYEDIRHAFHAERMVSLFQEMDAAIGSIIQQSPSPKNVPGDEQPGVHNAQDKASNSGFSKKCSLSGDASPAHNAQNKSSHSQTHNFLSANYRTSKKRIYEGNYEAMPNRSVNSEKAPRLNDPLNLSSTGGKKFGHVPKVRYFGRRGQKVKGSSVQSLADLQELTKLKFDLEKSIKLLEVEREKISGQDVMLARLNKQVITFDSNIELTDARKCQAIEDLDLKHNETRGLVKKLKEIEDFLVVERKNWSAEEIVLRGQVSDKDDELKIIKDELEVSRVALQTYQEAELGRFETWKQAYIRSDTFIVKVIDRFFRLIDLVIDETINQLKEGGYIPSTLIGTVIRRQKIIDSLPDDVLDDLE